MANAELVKKYSHPATIVIEQSTAGQQMAIDVYGQQINLICNYRTCNHKFSVHVITIVHVNAVTLSIMLQECH
jgi:hypothetical protein